MFYGSVQAVTAASPRLAGRRSCSPLSALGTCAVARRGAQRIRGTASIATGAPWSEGSGRK